MRLLRGGLRTAVLGGWALAFLLMAPASAQEATFNIAPKDAAMALAEWSTVSGIKIDAPLDLLKGKTTKGAVGKMDARAALDLMIGNAEIEITRDDGDKIYLSQSALRSLEEPDYTESDLFPEHIALSLRNNYYRFVLKEAYQEGVVARVTVNPFVGPDFAVGIERVAGKYRIITVQSDVRIDRYVRADHWEAELKEDYSEELKKDLQLLRAGMPAKIEDVRTTSCRAGVSNDLGQKLEKSVLSVLNHRFMSTSPSFDGPVFEVASLSGGNERWRGVFSLTEVESAFLDIAFDLKAYCTNPSLIGRWRLSGKLRTLDATLKSHNHQ